MDNFDLHILELMQNDASMTIADLASAVGLSTTPCWRRIQHLKKSGVIRKQVVLCDEASLNLSLTAFVTIRVSRHDEGWTSRFLESVALISEVLEVYRVAGEVDYLLKVVVPDVAGYDRVYKQLIKVADLMDVSSSFVMEVVRRTTALPTTHTRLR